MSYVMLAILLLLAILPWQLQAQMPPCEPPTTTQNTVQVAWDPPASPAPEGTVHEGYVLQRRTGATVTLQLLPSTATEHRDTLPNGTYYWSLRAVYMDMDEDLPVYSPLAAPGEPPPCLTIAALPPGPTQMTALPSVGLSGQPGYLLSWMLSDPTALVELERRPKKSGEDAYQVINYGPGALWFDAWQLDTSLAYCWRTRTKEPLSAYSEEACAGPLTPP